MTPEQAEAKAREIVFYTPVSAQARAIAAALLETERETLEAAISIMDAETKRWGKDSVAASAGVVAIEQLRALIPRHNAGPGESR